MSDQDGQQTNFNEPISRETPPPSTPPIIPITPPQDVTLPPEPTPGYVNSAPWPMAQPPTTGTGIASPTYPPPDVATPSYGYAPPSPSYIPPYGYGYTHPNPQYMPNRWQQPQGFFHSTAGRAALNGGAVLLVIVLLGSLGLAVSRILNPGPQGYLWTTSTEVDFIQWTEDSNHHLNGTLQSVSATPNNTVKSTTEAFTGVHDGSNISITFSALGFSSTLTGTLNGNTLTLSVPDQNGYLATDDFQAASVQDYNNAVNALRQRIQTQAAATQSAQATVNTQQAIAQATQSAQSQLDQAVTNANAKLSSDLQALSSDVQNLASNTSFSDVLNAYATDWSKMQKDYQQEKADYANGCGPGGYNAGTVSYDAGVVNYDLGTIQYDDGTLSYDQNAMSGPLSGVQGDIKNVQADWQNLKAAAAADTTGGVSAQYTQHDIDAAVSNAQKQVDASNTALSQAQSQGKQYDQEAAQMNADAQNLANSMHC